MRRTTIVAFLLASTLFLVQFATVQADEGWATWYGPGFHGQPMANGQIFDQNDPTTTAANNWPFGTWLRVTNPANGKSVEVQVRDRGAFRHALDLSKAAFAALADPNLMWLRVEYEVIPGPGQRAPGSTPSPVPTATSTPVPTATPRPAATATPPPPPPTTAATPPPPAPSGVQSPVPDKHTVAPGETLFSIARRYGLSTLALAQLNGIVNPEVIRVGQVLVLKAGIAPAPAATPPPATATPAPTATPPPPPPADASSHKISIGETLFSIARQYGLPVASIVQTNNISNPDLIWPDQVVSLPNRSSVAGSPPPPAPTPVAASTPRPTPAPAVAVTHRVAVGETISDIAAKYRVSVTDIAAANNLTNPDLVVIDQVLKLPSGAASAAAPAVASVPTPMPARQHEVGVGDTLWDIAVKYGLTVAKLQEANKLSADQPIIIGQILIIPGSAPAAPSFREYVVLEGDFLAGIAAQFGVSIDAMLAANELSDPGLLFVGQVLRIPS
jgi:peptidoglycan DL-endopeptidase LytF